MNKVLGIVLAILVGVAAGMCFLLSINSVMRESILPLGKELKTMPFHPEARPAAKVALAAGEQGKYHEMADAILENQQKMNTEGYKELAKKVGVNYNKLVKDLAEKDAEYEAIINHDLELVNQFDVRGTPTFFINGKKTMARDVDGIKADIEKALAAKGAK